MILRRIVLLVLISVHCFFTHGQNKIPFIFRQQEIRTAKNIARFIQHDTLVHTDSSIVHIHYSNTGGKPYLLLLHGMGVEAKSNWYRQIKELSQHFNLILPDLIWFGKSKTTTKNYSIEFQVNEIHSAISKLNLKTKMHVMGFSYGALAAAMFNQLYHDEVNKLIIIDGPVKYFSGKMADSLAQNAGVKSMCNLIVPQNLSEFKATQKAVMSQHLPFTKKIKRQMISLYFEPSVTSRMAQINYLIKNESNLQGLNYNLDITPTLLIWGGKDGVVPLSVGQSLNKRFPATTRLLVFRKAKHDVHFRCYKKLNKEVIKFLLN
ncbi:MAG: alpha/beta hydrolase [Bacteroidia bacterium]|nr:alpha/beta hydrolase [Bacteroidia bacterium]